MKKTSLLVLLTVIASATMAQKIISAPNVEKRNVSGYHAISVSGGIDLYLSQGDESVAVSASEVKYRDRIITEVKDGVLKIWYDHKGLTIDWGSNNRKMKAYVSFKDLDKLGASGGSDIDVDGAIKVSSLSINLSGGSDFRGKVEAGDLKVDASGGSDMDISGTVKNFTSESSGGSDLKGYGLVVDVCKLEASGGSDVYITVNKELSAVASGGSDIYYKGNGVVRDMRSGGSSSIKKTGS
ncbi:MAG: head GIN domain-containing protein [Bacteroidota bacterium]|nr:head GIN domain-containing protein [Bacteroidota bacterium]